MSAAESVPAGNASKKPLPRLRAIRMGLLVLLVTAAVVVAGSAFVNLRRAALAMGGDIVTEIARSFASEVQSEMLDARRTLIEVDERFPRDGTWQVQASILADFAVALNPGSKLIWGDRNGLSIRVGPTAIAPQLFIEKTQAAANPPGTVYDTVPGGPWKARTEVPRAYDPRERPWYTLAAGVTSMSWTEPYRFFSDGRAGLTLVMPLMDREGKMKGVLGLDLPLGTLTQVTQQYIRRLPSGREATILMIDEKQQLLVGPESTPAASSVGRDGLTAARESPNAVVRAAVGALGGEPLQSLEFDAGGERYLGTSLTFDVPMGVGPDRHWCVVVAVPISTVTQHVAAQGWLTVVVAILGLVLFGLLEWRVRTLRDQVRNARAVGSYRLDGLLARGGMGEVWRAAHQLLARPAAVKLIRPDSRHPEDIPRFQREAQATAALRSPHTVAVYDYGVADDGQFYYVMEMLDGVDLETLVTQFGPQPPGRVAWILRQCCASLGEAHANGLVHRDVKPSNIFICRLGVESDYVKLLDFGLVKSLETGLATASGILGTPSYMAPEQGRGVCDARSDIYSLGCVAWWLLTGATVFGDGSFVDLLLKHRDEAPQRPSFYLGRALPQGFEDIVMRCLAKAPADRPTALELNALLEACDAPRWTEAEADAWWASWISSTEKS